MEKVILILSVLLALCLFLLLRQRKKLKVHIVVNEENEKINAQLESSILAQQQQSQLLESQIVGQMNALNGLQEQAKNAADIFYEQSMETASAELVSALEKAGLNYEQASLDFQKSYLKLMEDAVSELNQTFTEKQTEIKKINEELYTMRNTRAALIEAQLREKRIAEQADFYRLHIDPIEQEDIFLLEKVKEKLNKPRILAMLIWQTYYQKQMSTLAASILGDKVVTGIYKITNIETTECYIGQAVNVAQRWKDHAKCGLGIDTPAGNKLYKAMQKFGLTNFTWELLEECPAAELNAKEAAYIELYKSVDFGYNSLKGNKS